MDELREKILEYLHRCYDRQYRASDYFEVHTVAMACAFGFTCARCSEATFQEVYVVVDDVVQKYLGLKETDEKEPTGG